MTPGGHGCDFYHTVRLVYRKIADPNSNNRTKDVHLYNNPNQNWTDILDVNDNDRYDLTLIVFNNKGLSAATMNRLFSVGQGILHIFIIIQNMKNS